MEVFMLSVCVWLIIATSEIIQSFAHTDDIRRFLLKKKYRPKYHISAPAGWLNDPNGFVYFKQQYHIFYQYYPYHGGWGPMHWGHVVSDDLVEWMFYPPVLVPKESYDKHGCLSGSAITHNGYLTLFYTGNYMSQNVTRQTQNVAISSDGVVFHKYLYNPIIRDGPYGNTDFRNPKVWKYQNIWYMIIGTSQQKTAYLLLYNSKDLFHWNLVGNIAHSFGDMGYMWENPDIFELDGYYVLILSVQGLQNDCFRFRNLYQTGYTIGNFDYSRGRFEDLEISTTTFHELDYGHDFYAVKTMQAPDGRRLLVAWLGMWESDFQESKDGWASMLTLIRELRLNFEGRVLMKPVREVLDLRAEILEAAWYSPGEAFYAGTKSFELLVNSSTVSYDAGITLEWNGDRQYIISYSAEHGYVSVDRGGIDGVRKADWLPVSKLFWRIFVDSSSIEIFCGEGEVVFSSRIYPKRAIQVRVGGQVQLHITQYKLKRSIRFDKYWQNRTSSRKAGHFKRRLHV